MDLTKLNAHVFEPLTGGANLDDHFVELYEDDSALVESVRRFVSIGINAGEAAVVVATPSHRAALERALARGLDLVAARAQGLYESLDAADTLSRFTKDGRVDPDEFDRVIGAVLARAQAGGRKVRIFGEMVALLWLEGDVAGALSLEDGWNRLAGNHAFRLFCAYPSGAFEVADTLSLTGVCNRHSHVLVAPDPRA